MAFQAMKFNATAERQYRLAATRRLIASATVQHMDERRPDPIRRTPQERIDAWTAEILLRRRRGR